MSKARKFSNSSNITTCEVYDVNNGEKVNLVDLWSDRKIILLLLRHFSCRHCQKHASVLNDTIDFFKHTEESITVVAIGIGTIEHAKTFLKKSNFQGELYCETSPIENFGTQSNIYKFFKCPQDPSYLFSDPARKIMLPEVLEAGEIAAQEGYTDEATWKSYSEEVLFQVGGTFVLGPGNACDYSHHPRFIGDIPDAKEIIRAAIGRNPEDDSDYIFPSTLAWANKLKVGEQVKETLTPRNSLEANKGTTTTITASSTPTPTLQTPKLPTPAFPTTTTTSTPAPTSTPTPPTTTTTDAKTKTKTKTNTKTTPTPTSTPTTTTAAPLSITKMPSAHKNAAAALKEKVISAFYFLKDKLKEFKVSEPIFFPVLLFFTSVFVLSILKLQSWPLAATIAVFIGFVVIAIELKSGNRLQYFKENVQVKVALFTPKDIDREMMSGNLIACDDCDFLETMNVIDKYNADSEKEQFKNENTDSFENENDGAYLGETMCYLRDFLAKPHPLVGRKGPVCPFMTGALRKNTIYLGVVHSSTSKQEDKVELATHKNWKASVQVHKRIVMNTAKSFVSRFDSLEPTQGKATQHKAVVIVFPDVPDNMARHVIDSVQLELKPEFVKRGLMIGEFHKQNNATGLRNPNFYPLRTPYATLAIRRIVPSDLPFMALDKYEVNLRVQFLESYLSQFSSDTPVPKSIQEQIDSAEGMLKKARSEQQKL